MTFIKGHSIYNEWAIALKVVDEMKHNEKGFILGRLRESI